MSDLTSVVITTHNRADLLMKTVESVLNQTYTDLEVIVVDNESEDDTKEKLSSFGNRIKYFYKKNEGACSARNFGIRKAAGKYIGLLDSDDIYLPDKIKLGVEHLKKNTENGFVHTGAYFIDENDQILSKHSAGSIDRDLILKNYICNSTVIARKSCLEEAGMFDETIFYPADWDMWLRLSKRYKVGYIDEPLTKYRISSQGCLKNLDAMKQECLKVLEKYFQDSRNGSRKIKKKAYSQLHLSMAQCYFLKDDHAKMKEEFVLSLKKNPLNFKAMAMFIYFFAARGHLKEKLQERIEHKQTKQNNSVN